MKTFGDADGTGAAARFSGPLAVATDSAGNVYVADTNNSTIRKITPAGVVSTLAGTAGVTGSTDATGAAARFNSPRGIATDSAGNVYVGDTLNFTIRKITPKGEVTTLAGTAGIFGSTDGTGPAARFYDPAGVATDSAGNVYVADDFNNTIRKVTPAGAVSTLVGVAEPGGSFGALTPGPLPGVLNSPVALAVSGTSLYITASTGVAVVQNLP
jgi:secreted PhoX family phosphatase